MAKILFKTANKNAINEKPRVYFTSHPDDFEKHFERVCEDIFKTQDCTVFYTENMSEPLTDDDLAYSLHNMNLFVVPVTYKLLSEENRAMQVDIPYALNEGIHILPLLMEPELDFLYSRENNFGKRQYIDTISKDLTAISYEKKLADFLSAKLTNDELRRRIRAEFYAYIFLSYRKKDRALANKLIQLIHSIPRYRDLAIWYDEFITLGEDFEKEIDHALEISRLFALLVTPNVLEDPNFVKDIEYKAANGKLPILPVEMQKTDAAALSECYADIPVCTKPLKKHLQAQIDRMLCNVSKKNDPSPEHTYLIGLAYVEGIDVEVNRERGLELITLAAESDSAEAMYFLNKHYTEKQDCEAAIFWGKKAYEHYLNKLGEENCETINALENLAYTYLKLHYPEDALPLYKRSYELYCKTKGETDKNSLAALSNLATCHSDIGDHKTGFDLIERSYILHCKVFGREDKNTLLSLCNLATACSNVNNHEKALELNIEAYTLLDEYAGKADPSTLSALSNLAFSYGTVGNHEKANELREKAYAISCEAYGEEAPISLEHLIYLAVGYDKAGMNEQALKCYEKSYHQHCVVYGEEHPDTLRALEMIGIQLVLANDYKKAIYYREKTYSLSRKIKGEEHSDTISVLDELGFIYGESGNFFRSLDLYNEVYKLRCKTLGVEHPDTLTSLHLLACAHFNVGMSDSAVILMEKAHLLQKKVLGEDDPHTAASAQKYVEFMQFQVAFLAETAYTEQCKMLGEEHPESLKLLRRLADANKDCGNIEEATRLYQKEYDTLLKLYGKTHPDLTVIAEILTGLKNKPQE